MSLIDNYLERLETNNKIREEGVYFTTDLVKPCMLNVYYGIKEEILPGKKQLRIFESGHLLEEWWVQNVLRNTPGVQIVATQLPARYIGDGWSVHGRLDALCLENNKLVVREVKTAKTCSWMSRAKEDHRQQLNFYLGSLGISLGVIDYIDKSVMLLGEDPRNPTLPPDTHYIIERNMGDYDNMIEAARVLHGHISTNTLPTPTPCWLCEKEEIYCDYYERCKKDYPDNPQIAAEPVTTIPEEIIGVSS